MRGRKGRPPGGRGAPRPGRRRTRPARRAPPGPAAAAVRVYPCGPPHALQRRSAGPPRDHLWRFVAIRPFRPGIRPRDYRGLPRRVEASLRRPGLRPLPAPVVDGGARLDPVRPDLDRADPVLDQDPDRLRPPRALPRVADHVALEDQARGLAPDPDAGGARAPPVVLDDVALQAVAVRRHPRGLVAEEHAVRGVANDLVATQQVVGVLVADRDAEPAVALQAV